MAHIFVLFKPWGEAAAPEINMAILGKLCCYSFLPCCPSRACLPLPSTSPPHLPSLHIFPYCLSFACCCLSGARPSRAQAHIREGIPLVAPCGRIQIVRCPWATGKIHRRCCKFHFGHRGLETPNTSKFVPHFGAGRRHKGTRRKRTWGQEGAALVFFGTNLEVLGVSRPLWLKRDLPKL